MRDFKRKTQVKLLLEDRYYDLVDAVSKANNISSHTMIRRAILFYCCNEIGTVRMLESRNRNITNKTFNPNEQ